MITDHLGYFKESYRVIEKESLSRKLLKLLLYEDIYLI